MENESLEKSKLPLAKILRRKIKILTKRLVKAQSERDLSLKWEGLHNEALLLQSHLYQIKKGMKEVHVLDWNQNNKEIAISLDPAIEPYLQIEKRYKVSRKLKKGIPYKIAHVKKIEEELGLLQSNLSQLEAITSIEDLATFQHTLPVIKESKKPISSEITKKVPYKEFRSLSGFRIWVGKSAKDNDNLTFNYAHGSDWWLHVCDFPGSHVVIKIDKGSEPDQETLSDAMQLALEYSKAHEEAGICLTQCKYLKRFGKQKGKVHVSKHKIVHVVKDPIRLERLKGRL